MTSETANAYLRTKVMTASPAELRLLLFDGAIKFALQGREGLAQRDFEKSYEGLSQAKSILMELITSLRPEVDPELCSRLSGLYTYMYRQLMEASLERKPEMVDEVVELLEYERETWSLLIEKLAKEKGGASSDGASGNASGDEATDGGAPPAPRKPLSVQG